MLWFAIMKSQPDGPPHAVLEHKADEVLKNLKGFLGEELTKTGKRNWNQKQINAAFDKAFNNYIKDFKHKSIYID